MDQWLRNNGVPVETEKQTSETSNATSANEDADYTSEHIYCLVRTINLFLLVLKSNDQKINVCMSISICCMALVAMVMKKPQTLFLYFVTRYWLTIRWHQQSCKDKLKSGIVTRKIKINLSFKGHYVYMNQYLFLIKRCRGVLLILPRILKMSSFHNCMRVILTRSELMSLLMWLDRQFYLCLLDMTSTAKLKTTNSSW